MDLADGREGDEENEEAQAGNDSTPRTEHMRSTLATIINVISSIKHVISERHTAAMKKTPFNMLLDSVINGRIQTSHCRKMDANIIVVVQMFNTETRTVKLGLQEVGFTIEDVKYIFGIVDGKRKIEVSKGGRKDSVVVQRLFPNDDKLTQKLLRQRLQDVAGRNEDVDIEDTVRLLCLILISSLFFSSSGLSIPWGWIEYVKDLETMKSYDWCSKILNTLIYSMAAKKDTPSKISGCTIFLLYWLCEHTDICAPRKLINDTKVPRIVKWNLPDLWTTVNRSKLMQLAKHQVKVGGLVPTTMESKLLNRESITAEVKSASTGTKKRKKMVKSKGMSEYMSDQRKDNISTETLQGGKDIERAMEEWKLETAKLKNEIHQLSIRTADLEAENNQQRTKNLEMEQNLVVVQETPLQIMPPTVECMGKQYSVTKLVSQLPSKDNELEILRKKVERMEEEIWRKNEELNSKVVEISELRNEYAMKKCQMVTAETKLVNLQKTNAHFVETVSKQNEQIASLERKIHEMEDVIGNFEPPAPNRKRTTQMDRKTPNSMYKKVKTRKRKAFEDDAFKYGKSKREEKAPKRIAEKSKNSSRTTQQASFIRTIDRKCTGNCARLLSSECMERIMALKTKILSETVYWTEGGHTVVDVQEIYNIMVGNFVDNFVIDAYGIELLKNTGHNSFIVNSNCWDRAPGARPYHWTLLVWDTQVDEWSHYNSMKPRHDAAHDPWFEDAKYMKNEIESKTKPPPELGLATQDIAQPIHSVKDLPQQEDAMNDCAIFVCYFMTQLMMKGVVDRTITRKDMNQFKAHIIESIVMKKWLL